MAYGPQCGLGAVGEVELHQDVRDMRLDRLLGEDQGAGDLTVGAAVRYQSEHLALPFGERTASPLARVGLVLREERAGDLRLEQDVAGVDRADGAGEGI